MAETENAITKDILDYLRWRYSVVCWRNNNALAGRGRRSTGNTPNGLPDILGILPSGQFLGIEVKTEDGVVRPEQKEFIEIATRMGAVVGVCRSRSDVDTLLKALWKS